MINLLLNILILIICVFVYYIFLRQRPLYQKYKNFIIGCVSIVGIFLCMMFPYYDVDGHVYDLRMVAFLIGALYGGRVVSFMLLIGVISIRTTISINLGLYVTIGICLLIWIYTFFVSKKFIDFSFQKKLLHMISFITIISSIKLISLMTLLPEFDTYYLSIIINHYLIKVFSLVIILYIIEDIHQNLKIEEELYEAEKLRVVSELAASVSHEIRNPLTVTKGFLQLLKNNNIDQQKRKMYLELSLEELERAQNIITDYLTYAKPHEYKGEEILDVKQELTYLVQVMTPFALMQGVEIKLLDDGNAYIKGDKYRFRQGLVNLVKNGIESMPTGGLVEINYVNKYNEVNISICDHGAGMTKWELAMLGSPFDTGKLKGTGLGTLVTYRIVHSMNGKIIAKSKKGEGTTFQLTFIGVDKI